MNIIKHMEAAFILSLAVAGATAVAVDSLPQAQAHVTRESAAQARIQAAIQPGIPVVHVSAKRMTPVQKQQSLALERVAKRA